MKASKDLVLRKKEELNRKRENLQSSQKLASKVVILLSLISAISIFLGSGYVFDSIWVQVVLAVVGALIVFFLNNALVKEERKRMTFLVFSVIITLVLSSTFTFFFLASNSALIAEAQEELENYKKIIGQHTKEIEIASKAIQLLRGGSNSYSFNANEESKGAFSGSRSSVDGNQNFLESRFKGLSNLFENQILLIDGKLKKSNRAVLDSKDILKEAEERLTQKPSGSKDLKKYMADFENLLLSLDQSIGNYNGPKEEIILAIGALENYESTELNVQPTGTTDLAQNQRGVMDKIKSGLQDYIEDLKRFSSQLERIENDNQNLKLYSQQHYNPMVACVNHIDVTWMLLLIAVIFDCFPYIVLFINFSKQTEIEQLEKELTELEDEN